MTTIVYFLLMLGVIPLLPIIIYQGKKIRRTVPRLPEAKGNSGTTGSSDQVLRLLTIGESTIAGVGVEFQEEGYSGHLAKSLSEQFACQVEWQVNAKSGITIGRLVERLRNTTTNLQPDIIVVGMGGNDTFKFHSPKKWRSEALQLIDLLQKKYPEIPIVFTNLPPVKDYPAFSSNIQFFFGNLMSLFRVELSKLVQNRHNVWFIENEIRLQDWKKGGLQTSDFFSDGVHPSALTYQMWAKLTSEYIFENHILKTATLSQKI